MFLFWPRPKVTILPKGFETNLWRDLRRANGARRNQKKSGNRRIQELQGKKRIHAGLAPVDGQLYGLFAHKNVSTIQMILQLTPVLLGTCTYMSFTCIIFCELFFLDAYITIEKYWVFICSIYFHNFHRKGSLGASLFRLRWTKRIEWFCGPRWMRTTLGRWPRMSSRRGNRQRVGGFGVSSLYLKRWNLTRTCLLLNWVFVSYQRWGSGTCPLDDHPDSWIQDSQEKLDIDFAAAKYAKALAAVQAHGWFFLRGCILLGSQPIG